MTLRTWLTRHGVMLMILFACLFFGPVSNMLSQVYETRLYRDVSMATPFHSVVLTDSKLEEGTNSIILSGTFIKRRCDFGGLSGYVFDTAGVGHLTTVDTEVDDVRSSRTGNRPPATKPQAWGPWALDNYSLETPESYEIWVRHTCPESPTPQENLFLSGPWE